MSTSDHVKQIHQNISNYFSTFWLFQGEAISEAFGPVDVADQELLDELDELVAEDDKKKVDEYNLADSQLDQDLLDRLNRLGVVDQNPGMSKNQNDFSSNRDFSTSQSDTAKKPKLAYDNWKFF